MSSEKQVDEESPGVSEKTANSDEDKKKEEATNGDIHEQRAAVPTADTDNPMTIRNCGIVLLVIVVIFAIGIIIGVSTRTTSSDEVEEGTEAPTEEEDDGMVFNRITSFPICMQLDEYCNGPNATNAEIIYASEDGMMLAYTDASYSAIGLINITDPVNPVPSGVIDMGGEPTSLIVTGNYIVVGVNTSPDFINPSGVLKIVDMETATIYHEMDLGGQPDSVALSPDKTYIAVAIENERDEDRVVEDPEVDAGGLPQMPPGYLVVVDSSNADPKMWTSSIVDLVGLPGLVEPSDPEPEYVDINADNVCVVTLQENNALVLVDLPTLEVITSFTAGMVDLSQIDIADDGIITVVDSLSSVPREPDGVAWIGTEFFATADEGDWNGGSRGFTIYNLSGDGVYTSGITMEWEAMRLGEYPDGRSDNKGNEPENVRYAEYGNKQLLFVNSERSSLVFVYNIKDIEAPELLQILPATVGPEGTYAIPDRDLFVVACEEDAREDKMRSHVVIYQRQEQEVPDYPVIVSVDREDGTPRPFAALSALASGGDDMLYTVEDSFFRMSRIFAINATSMPYTIVDDMRVMDTTNMLRQILTANETAILLNDDMTVNLDLEGIDVIEDGSGFWICSEGRGTVADAARPYETPNLIVRLSETAEIEEAVRLPAEVESIQVRFGFEGVAIDGDHVVVTFQRAWQGEEEARLGIFNTVDKTWKFVFYPLDTPISQFGGWVGLSDIESMGEGKFLILERDNQGGPDAALKRLYMISLGDFSIADGSMVPGKRFIRDLIPDLEAGGRSVIEKVEGLAIDDAGNVWINTDNDGVDDNSGENLLLNLGDVL